MGAALLAQLATLVPFVFGLATASIIATKAPEFMDPAAPNYVGGLLAVSPAWYFVPLCAIALIGGMSTGATSLYGTGLDFSSVFPRLDRVQATLFIGVLAIAFIFVGRFAFNVVQSISTFATLIIYVHGPLDGGHDHRLHHPPGLVRRRRPPGLQPPPVGRTVLVQPRLEFPRMGAWLASAVTGLSMVNIPGQFQGPLGNLAGGVDISLPASLVLAAVLYLGHAVGFPGTARSPPGRRAALDPLQEHRSTAGPRRSRQRRPASPAPTRPRSATRDRDAELAARP